MKAMILCAGFGKRLNPLTLKCPKPLLKIDNETLLSNSIKFLQKFGVESIVINVHYLREQIIDYINKNKFSVNITIVKEEDKILDTGGGVLNAINNFSNNPFIIINPDTIWCNDHLEELKKMKKTFFSEKKAKCSMLIIDKNKSFDHQFKGDFNLTGNLINRENKNNLNYIFTGLQIINPEVFDRMEEKIFSINKIWDKLILTDELYGFKSNVNFFHVSTLKVYENLIKEKLNIN